MIWRLLTGWWQPDWRICCSGWSWSSRQMLLRLNSVTWLHKLCNTLPSLPLITTLCGGDFFMPQTQINGQTFWFLLSYSFPFQHRIESWNVCFLYLAQSRLTSVHVSWSVLARILLASFNADSSVDLWWSDKARKLAQKKRKEHRLRCSGHPSMSQVRDNSSDNETEDILECWDNVMCTDSGSDSGSN